MDDGGVRPERSLIEAALAHPFLRVIVGCASMNNDLDAPMAVLTLLLASATHAVLPKTKGTEPMSRDVFKAFAGLAWDVAAGGDAQRRAAARVDEIIGEATRAASD